MCSLAPFHLGIPGHVHRGGRQVLPGRAGVGPRPSTLHWGHIPGSQAREVSCRVQNKSPFIQHNPYRVLVVQLWLHFIFSMPWAMFAFHCIAMPGNQKSDCAATHEELHLSPNKHMAVSCKGVFKKWGGGVRCRSIRKRWYVVLRWWVRLLNMENGYEPVFHILV